VNKLNATYFKEIMAGPIHNSLACHLPQKNSTSIALKYGQYLLYMKYQVVEIGLYK